MKHVLVVKIVFAVIIIIEKCMCPAYSKICSNCGRYNHFAIGCKAKSKDNRLKFKFRNRDKKVNAVTSYEDSDKNSDSEDSDSISFDTIKVRLVNNKIRKSAWFETIVIGNEKLTLKKTVVLNVT